MNAESDGTDDWLDLARCARYKTRKVAQLLKISLRQLERAFIDGLGCTPRAWLYQVKLWDAVPPLLEGKSPKALFYDLGFKNAPSFFHAFREYHGWTTREYIWRHLQLESKALRQLRESRGVARESTNLQTRDQHVTALAILRHMPASCENLTFYYRHFACCRNKTSNVARE